MKARDVKRALRKSYYDAIQNNVTWQGKQVKFYSIVPADKDFPYITVQSQTSNTVPKTKSSLIYDCTITLDIITSFPKSAGSYAVAEDIAEQILDLVYDQGNNMQIEAPFLILTTQLELDETLEESTENEIIVRRLLRFQHLIDQTA